MTLGALLVLITGQITLPAALASINTGVMIFLTAMFVIGQGVKESGVLGMSVAWICRYAKNGDNLLILLICTLGFFSSLLMNDTVAIIATPIIISLAIFYGIRKEIAILALCFSVTTGSVFSPVGNPQNYLIASYVPELSPFILFFSGLFIPTLISLGIIFLFLRKSFRISNLPSVPIIPDKHNDRMYLAVMFSFLILLLGVCIRIISSLISVDPYLPIEWIAAAAAVPVLLISSSKVQLIKGIDWRTLAFFLSMFILMQSVYNTGYFQDIFDLQGTGDVILVLFSGVLLSQFISNVPFVALFQPLILSGGASPAVVLALVAGSTIAGNLTILGAASNVIILEQAEREGVSISMLTFCRYGIPITICQAVVYALFLIK